MTGTEDYADQNLSSEEAAQEQGICHFGFFKTQRVFVQLRQGASNVGFCLAMTKKVECPMASVDDK